MHSTAHLACFEALSRRDNPDFLCCEILLTLWRVEIAWLAGIRLQAHHWSQFSSHYGEPHGLVLQRLIYQINCVIQAQHSCIEHQIIQVRIVRVTMVLGLQVTMTIALFELDAPSRRISIKALALHHIGDALFERCNYASMQHVSPVCQQHLRSSANN